MTRPPPKEIPPLREAFAQFRRLLQMIRPYWYRILKGMVLSLVIGFLGMLSPYLSKLLIDEVYPSQNVTLLHVLVAGTLTITVTSTLMGLVRGYYTLHLNSQLSSAASLAFFNHLQHLSVRFFEERRVGEIMSRFSDVSSSLNTVSRVFETLFVQSTYLLLVPPFLFLLNWKLAMVALVSIPITAAIITVSGRIVRKYSKQASEAYADISGFQVEVFSHIRNLKVMAVEHDIYSKAQRQVQDALRLQLKAGGVSQGVGAINALVGALNTAFLTWFSWRLILSQEMTLGDYVAFTAYIAYLYGPLTQITNLFAEFQKAAVNIGRMFEYLDAPVEQDPSHAYNRPPAITHRVHGQITLQGVYFGYNESHQVLRDVSVSFQPGTVTAIIGPSGAGKSSLLRLISRIEHPTQGNILFDGMPAGSIPLTDLRRQMSVVWQEFSLMRGTIWENLTMGVEAPQRHTVEEIIRLCRLDSLIAQLPNGYETSVAEWGASVSGGQRQRIAIARALIRDAPILLLDEATSNIDVRTETEILHDLFQWARGKTVIFVTHRIATAVLADRIYLVDGGGIAATGTHEELLRGEALYRQMIGNDAMVEDIRRNRPVQPTQ